MQQEQVMTRARLVLPGEVVTGTVVLRGGRIVDLDQALSTLPSAIDLEGDFLLPGLVELHTDNLERHAMPRPKVRFPMWGAVQAHDAEVACAGITTVFDAIGVGDPYGQGFRAQNQGELLSVLDALDAAGVLRADHRIHARCELPAANARALFEPFAHHPRLGLISLMDHTPGQRQWSDLDHARVYYTGKKGWTDAQFDQEVRLAPARQTAHARPNRDWFAAYARATGTALASHDDTTAAHVDEAHHLGAVICEFPTTLDAARRARARGLLTLAGAPNVLRGTSHAGNVAVATLVREGVLDALSSDYVPASLLAAAWQLAREDLLDLPAAVRLVTLQPARAAGLADRGALAPGLRADLVRVREVAGHPVVRAVWNSGRRVV
ncbi:alpha-D-ribose 1-methylphosphonate 5-triphosphate diphosphatase [Sphaerotilus sp.]|uniref:alpha-D-ribose 1-methylphosphonate 5-triphosphate diphosphatase n=1 Tax=Sphaerotilus sp. TaxID=2093942 RepID=UPI00286E5778|nr:alpha-D-ribose 1-methylphosphonate 5-triphosphate diphosphatase [Sphaerotilus sp.]